MFAVHLPGTLDCVIDSWVQLLPCPVREGSRNQICVVQYDAPVTVQLTHSTALWLSAYLGRRTDHLLSLKRDPQYARTSSGIIWSRPRKSLQILSYRSLSLSHWSSQLLAAIKLLMCIRKTSVSNLSQNTKHPAMSLSWVSPVFPGKQGEYLTLGNGHFLPRRWKCTNHQHLIHRAHI
jgi:hypothetical protein